VKIFIGKVVAELFPYLKLNPEEKVGMALGWGASQNLGIPLQYLHSG